MKYFVVTNTRTYIFCNHPLDPHGTNLCLPFALSQRNNEEWFDDKYISSRTEDGLLVFAQVWVINLIRFFFTYFYKYNKKNTDNYLTFLVASKKGETETFLRSQLDLFYQLLIMVWLTLFLVKIQWVNFPNSPGIWTRLITWWTKDIPRILSKPRAKSQNNSISWYSMLSVRSQPEFPCSGIVNLREVD